MSGLVHMEGDASQAAAVILVFLRVVFLATGP